MTAVAMDGAVARLRSLAARELGLAFEEGRVGQLEEAVRRRLEATRASCEAWIARLDDPRVARLELRAMVADLTVGETYFFRNVEQLRAFAEVALPDRVRARAATRSLRILSAGCASGEEPYSLAIVARQQALDPSWRVELIGVDLNGAALERARAGRYSAWSLRETAADVQRRWFRSEGRELVLDPGLRADVAFEERNLALPDPGFWGEGAFDVVFCRNVLMYFAPDRARELVERIARALVPGGYLFLGHAETLRGLSHDFHLRHTHDAFYYQRRDAPPLAAVAAPSASVRPADPAALLSTALDDAASWIDAIQRASRRISELADGRRAPPAPASAPGAAGPTPRFDVARALELVGRERFGEALALIDGWPAAAARDADVLLLRAALLTHRGDLAAAAQACAALLDLDELSAGAHYLLALCREGDGRRREALEHDQIAAYLDPTFAMPRLHLGILARRSGDAAGARRELEQALHLLQREESTRLLLFGGGFGREALCALARAELAGCGGAR